MDCGFATWESADYFKKWQENLIVKLQLLNTKVKETLNELKEEEHEGMDCDILQCSQEIDENKDVPVQIKIKRENKNRSIVCRNNVVQIHQSNQKTEMKKKS